MGGSQISSDMAACKAELARRFPGPGWLEGADVPARNTHDASFMAPVPPSGVVRLTKLQLQGHAYIKP